MSNDQAEHEPATDPDDGALSGLARERLDEHVMNALRRQLHERGKQLDAQLMVVGILVDKLGGETTITDLELTEWTGTLFQVRDNAGTGFVLRTRP